MNATTRAGMAALVVTSAALWGCSYEAEGLAPAQPARTTVKMDFFHKPLPEIPLPNDLATRYDSSSATERRINASMIAPTAFESGTRREIDNLDGWGVLQPIVVPFTGPLDVPTIIARHSDEFYDLDDDVLYLINIDPQSPEYGRLHHLDLGNGNFPYALEDRDRYWKNDPRGDSISLAYEETYEDLNGNGLLDPGEDVNGNGLLDEGEDLDDDGELDPPEDTDADGILDVPNYLPGHHPPAGDLAARADALMTFYERSTNTLIAQPMMPLRERTRYAVVITRRILDAGGQAVGSPYPYIHHLAQTEELRPLLAVLPPGIGTEDVAFAFSFTTQTIEAGWQALREGLYGHGPQAHLATEFPARLASIPEMRDQGFFPNMENPHLMYGEVWREVFEKLAEDLIEMPAGAMRDAFINSIRYVDYFASGTFQSPQLLPRVDGAGNLLPLNDQVWPPDIHRVPVNAAGETVHVTFVIPRKEVSVRKDGRPAPVVVMGHGYTTSRFEGIQLAGFVAKLGLAVATIDGPSHGLALTDFERAVATGMASEYGIGSAVSAILSDRAFDQNRDDIKDSGADFWTSYMVHTRDMVRQFALDYMQLVRVIRSFDGQRRWGYDLDGDGQSELAGDFDGDGVLDIGGDAPVYAFGASLGGFMATLLGAIEPEVDLAVPISAGGGISYLGLRSHQGGVYQAFMLRAMGPLWVGTLDEEGGQFQLETIVPDLTDDVTVAIGQVSGVAPGDTMVVENLANGVRRCGFVSLEGTVRVGLESDAGDPTRIFFYKGPQLIPGPIECLLRGGVQPFVVMDTFGQSASFQDQYFEAGEPLIALADGLGLRRGHPDLRRIQGLAQLVLDPADPAVMARHLMDEPLVYPSTGERTGAHSLIITTMGDMGVPAAGGASLGRAAGLISFLEPDPRYGKSANQVLIDTYTIEGVHNLNRYTDSEGNGVHMDVDVFSDGDDMYGDEIPRLDPPLRIGLNETDPLGGVSAALFPYNVPEGMHGFDLPGGMIDRARDECREACPDPPEGDPCGCDTLQTFDIGFYMVNLMGAYLASGGTHVSTERCMSSDDCPGYPDVPEDRDVQSLP